MTTFARHVVLFFLLCGAVIARAQSATYVDLHDFGSGLDGQDAEAGVTFDKAGDAFGTTERGGANDLGMVWEVTAGGTYKDLHDFGSSTDGAEPYGNLVFDSAGDIFGTAAESGAHQYGMIWEITAAGQYKDLHDFDWTDGAYPYAGASLDAKGDLFGTANQGGANSLGMIWEITSSGTFKDLHDFGATGDGEYPRAGVSFDSAGNAYGTAFEGGANGGGMVWEITASGGAYSDLHDFGAGTDGGLPYAGVAIDSNGNLYGTTSEGGANTSADQGMGGGMIWEITSSRAYKDLHDFGGSGDGLYSGAGVSFDSKGDLFGTTGWGGVNTEANFGNGGGVVWEIGSSGTYQKLHDFGAGEDGSLPFVGVTVGADGNLYGATSQGGANDSGMLWGLSVPTQIASVSLNPSTVTGGASSTGTVTLSAAAPSGGLAVSLSSSSADATVPSSVTVPAGDTSATFTITTISYHANVTSNITARYGSSSQKAVLSILAPTLASITLNPTTVTGGSTCTGTVTLTGPAASGGLGVSLSSSSTYATVPSSVTVAAGATKGTFTISTKPYTGDYSATITAAQGSSVQKAVLSVLPAAVGGLSLNPSTVTGGSSSTGTVTLTGPAPTGGSVVTLSSTSADATVPSSVTVAAGSSSATFTISTISYHGNVTATITAVKGSSSQKAVLSILAPVLSGLSLNPSTVTGATTSTGTVTLTGPAPTGGVVVTLSSTSADATVPSSVTVAAGSNSATFKVTTVKYSGVYKATITARYGSSSEQAVLTVDP